MTYDVDYFINTFSAIPEDKWLIGCYSDGDKGCAMGLLTHVVKDAQAHSVLYDMGNKYFRQKGSATPIIEINNGDYPEYQQPTPKQRILAALRDIKEKLNSEPLVKECDATMSKKVDAVGIKIIHVYHKVEVPETIGKSVPETILS